ncbi:hypothetical protein [Blastococcus sp. CCUG 61487]|uniref:hypothetical protein n=1 Tax=Blastococcus sp. CCUG 61487 TaxID=1840703 RepID=UPI0010C120CE|nr:hypothetical protein [Blastococcus sp. CCUG 61487]TKJ24362.1 hypothetical protein A6V29_05025 [Blastococcus sp. CCUG 61487]
MPDTASPAVRTVEQAAAGAMVGDLDDVVVLAGINDQQEYQSRQVTIAGTWDPEIESLTSNHTVTVLREQLGAGRRVRETSAIACLAFSGDGDRDLQRHRAAVEQVITALHAALRAVAQLEDGTPATARIDEQQWAEVIDEQGGGVMCLFTVIVVALP